LTGSGTGPPDPKLELGSTFGASQMLAPRAPPPSRFQQVLRHPKYQTTICVRLVTWAGLYLSCLRPAGRSKQFAGTMAGAEDSVVCREVSAPGRRRCCKLKASPSSGAIRRTREL
jgi:hypothetical protein